MVASFTDLHVTHSHSGIMSSRLAEEWMEKCLLPSIPDRSVLLLDLWCGFNSMKLLRAVARKKLEGVTFPHGQRRSNTKIQKTTVDSVKIYVEDHASRLKKNINKRDAPAKNSGKIECDVTYQTITLK
ncbi:unnamed protein product [Caenorhabditis nigoni]